MKDLSSFLNESNISESKGITTKLDFSELVTLAEPYYNDLKNKYYDAAMKVYKKHGIEEDDLNIWFQDDDSYKKQSNWDNIKQPMGYIEMFIIQPKLDVDDNMSEQEIKSLHNDLLKSINMTGKHAPGKDEYYSISEDPEIDIANFRPMSRIGISLYLCVTPAHTQDLTVFNTFSSKGETNDCCGRKLVVGDIVAFSDTRQDTTVPLYKGTITGITGKRLKITMVEPGYGDQTYTIIGWRTCLVAHADMKYIQ